ncbi:MAG: aminotransferase, partial [Armatimonadota bacterium]
PEYSCGLTTVEIRGVAPAELAAWLWDKHRIFVTSIEHEQFKGIRVTPNVYTTHGEVDLFADAMLSAARHGIG